MQTSVPHFPNIAMDNSSVALKEAHVPDVKKVGSVVEKDRHSRTGISGLPKKGGAGGKGTWGVGGKDDLKLAPKAVDKNDPNYCSDDDDEIVMEKVEEQNPVEAVLKEYFSSGDVDELSTALQSLNISNNMEAFVKKSIAIALEKQAYERELVSQMLSALYGNTITAEKMEAGFQRAIESIEDLCLDTPDGIELVSKFTARAVVDEILPPSFLKSVHVSSEREKEILSLANALVTEKHRSGRLAHIWGPGDLSSVKRLKEEVLMLLGEFLSTGELQEADKSVRKLNAPSFYFQLVKQALRFGISRTIEEQRKKISQLLNSFSKSGLISSDHMIKGFQSCHDILGDIALDVPNAHVLFGEFVLRAKEGGYLPQDLQF